MMCPCVCGHPPDDHQAVDWEGDGPFCGSCWLDERLCRQYRPPPRMPRPIPPSMRPLPRWQWVAGIVAAIVLVVLLVTG